jgi:hypothetical protein
MPSARAPQARTGSSGRSGRAAILRAWLKLAGTRGTDEIAAAIHAFRAS